MAVVYIGYSFKVQPMEPGKDILLAQLGEVGFESFDETEDGLDAFIQKMDWREDILDEIQILSSEEFTITYDLKEIAPVNWNIEWEKNFESIEVDGICTVRAPFHLKGDVEYDIIIEPKMSFGTGHHETTFMMLQYILETDYTDKSVLDMGCGTAVLAILAEMKGASEIDAIDIDPWCFENSEENVKRNNCTRIRVYEGDVTLLKDRKYDVILKSLYITSALKPAFKSMVQRGFRSSNSPDFTVHFPL